MSAMTELVDTWYRRVWAEGDVDAIDEMMVAETPVHGLGAQTLVGPAAFRAFHGALMELISDVDVTIDKAIETDDWIAFLCTVRARRRDTGAPLVTTGQAMARIADGKIIEAYNHFDMVALFGGCGLMPTDAVERCLGGERVG